METWSASKCYPKWRANMQIAIAVMHLGRLAVGGDALILLMATQCILLWLRLQYYLRCANLHLGRHEHHAHLMIVCSSNAMIQTCLAH